MQCSEFLDAIERRLDDQIKRGRAAGQSMSPDQLNSAPDSKHWSVAQIFEHMMLGNTPYLPLMQAGIEASKADSGKDASHTFFAKLIIKAAGPQGSAPAPKQMEPKPGPYTPDIVERWAAQTEAVLALVKSAHGRDLSASKLRNPYLSFVKQNLADCFMILTEHTERHVRQIEERAKGPR